MYKWESPCDELPPVFRRKVILESGQNIELVNANRLRSYADEKDASDETDGEVMGEGQ